MNTKPIAYTSFLDAVNYGNQQSILCNNILNIDPDLLYTDDSFADTPLDEQEFEEKEKNNFTDYDAYLEWFDEQRFDVYQWFITDLSEDDARFKYETFGLEFYYSEALDCYIMPVYHYGTSWRILACPVYNEDFVKYNPDIIYKSTGGYVNV